ncbi:YARHG domain-containing protein [Bradyrhizobium zhanjiangense]|uniref:YARHG domain-containing protein n=1 Tax=Bradyrhizobium zhanjiangense TaxID=1325107 RepID=A0ABY0DLF2_9BRAD|nr:YARHG domain-containing protein [Bradyrhizobium zhanjiangense]RXG93510.1 YARHG domain-containing protein [Bradyrhizobium zhanjiangense]
MYWKKILSALLFAACFAFPAAAEKRVALVIGNSAYRSVPRLENPANDAQLVADTLQRLGFILVGGGAQIELDKAGFDNAVQRFGNQLIGADVALFYYAGHGIQVRGANYLVPITANPTRETDVDFQMVDAALVLRQMDGAGTKLNIVILDACRNNPFGGRGLRGSDGGLAQIRAPEGTLLSYATQPGNVALDGADGHSPYTRALVETMQRPGLDVLQTFNQVGLIVKRATGSAQQPWVSTSPIDGSFYFSGAAAGQVAAVDVPATVTAPTSNPPSSAPVTRTQSDFLFPDSDSRLLADADLRTLSKDELRLARNEIFARRGRYFSAPDLTARFSKFAWYVPRTWDPQLSAVEKANVALIERYESGGPSQSGFIFPDSDRRLLTSADLRGLSNDELRIARNEIFARRGRYFEAADLKARFERFSWYSPNTWNPKLNSIEEANVALLDQAGKRR